MYIKKAVIPAAGFGTRMLPATKAIPKELLTVVDKPAIQYVVEEAAASGVTDILMITGRGKGDMEDHFDRMPELELVLSAKGRFEALDAVVRPAKLANMHYIRQQQALGLGHAVYCAKSFVGQESFFVLLPDDLIDDPVPCAEQLRVLGNGNESIIAVQEVPWKDTGKYGVVSIDYETGLVNGIVEKPAPEDAPSNLAVVGRYLLQPEVFGCLEEITPGAGGELQLTDAIALMIQKGLPVRVCKFSGVRYDVGSPLGFLEANVGLALAREDMRDRVLKMLRAKLEF
jgi:UTP--glucose-1-phosphate uridylyltransferase